MFESKKFVEVILPLALPGTYTYAVPEELESSIAVGKRVEVQFGKKKIYAAVISKITDVAPTGFKPKYISSVLDENIVLHPQQLELWKWMAEYYCCTIGEVMNAALPAGLKLESETTIVISPNFNRDYTSLDDREYLVAEALEIKRELTMEEIAQMLQLHSVYAVVQSLLKKNVILLKEELVERYKPRTETLISINEKYKEDVALKELLDTLERAPKQQSLVLAYLQLTHPFSKEIKKIQKKILLTKAGADPSILNSLVKKEIFIAEEKIVQRLEDADTALSSFLLNEQQQEAFSDIKQKFETHAAVLLHGVTGSGKTNIYVKLIEECINSGKQALYLLPEIALTSQITARLRNYFGNSIGIYHSRFNQQERVEIWNKLIKHEYNVILGARSALFMPFDNLGLIIVDEEHDSSYKQQSPAPRYHARDAAIAYAAQFNAKVLLGTATPSMETYLNCKQDKFGLTNIKERFGGSEMPELSFVNIKDEKRLKLMKAHFSSVLLEEMSTALLAKEQVILFQNRRGYAPFIECEDCNNVPHCPNCDVSLTYYKLHNELKCHYCGYRRDNFVKCPACGSTHLVEKGFGTEKIEDEISIFFPDAKIARMDTDSVKTKQSHDRLIGEIESGNIDILVGTQMVTKGLDFDRVGVVGIISADQLLQYPDFRSNERAYQLIEQVSGRAGRRQKRGRVIVQVQNITHPVIRFLLETGHEKFYEWELEHRKRLMFPPFIRLIQLTVKHKDARTARQSADILAEQLKAVLDKRVNGPVEPLINKIRNEFYFEILLKVEKNTELMRMTRETIRHTVERLYTDKKLRSTRVEVDVDPY